jgi:hypothetical protein
VIVLGRRSIIRIRAVTARGSFLVGYFPSVEAINNSGRPIELADRALEGAELQTGGYCQCDRANASA